MADYLDRSTPSTISALPAGVRRQGSALRWSPAVARPGRPGLPLSLATGLLLCALLAITAVAAAQPDPAAILSNIDQLRTFPEEDFSAVVTMVTEDPEKGVEKRVVRFFRRDRENKFVLLFEEPKIQKGQGYLRVGSNLWFYDPESRRFVHTSLKENLEGTDAKSSDFARSTLAEDYEVTSITEGQLGRYEVYILELEARNDEVPYPYLKMWVTKDPNLVLKTEEYSLSKRLLRTSLFPKYAKVKNAYIATRMIFIDELVEGRKTQISLDEVSLAPLPDSVFTKSFLERVNR